MTDEVGRILLGEDLRTSARPRRGSTWRPRAAPFASTAIRCSSSCLLEQPRQPPVLEHAPAGLTVRAVVDRVLLEVHLGNRMPAGVTGLVEVLVDAVRAFVVRAAFAQLEPAPQLDRIAEARRSISSSDSSVVSAYGESFAAWRISFAHARPMPAIARWSRRSEWSRREFSCTISASAAVSRSSASGPRWPSSSSACSGVISHTPARFFEPASVRTSSRSVLECEAKRRLLRPRLAEAEPAEASGGHQVDDQDEVAVSGRKQEPLAAPLHAGEALALERAQGRVDRLQRRDVRGACSGDGEGGDGIVQRPSPRLHFGDFWH